MPAPNEKDKPKKQGLLKYLDNTIGDDGLRTDVKITVTNETAFKIIGVSVVSTALSAFTFFFIRKLFTPKN